LEISKILKSGDIVVSKFGKTFSHCGIVYNGRVSQAFWGNGVVALPIRAHFRHFKENKMFRIK
jgi:cell wall-associated NlpC family hydrolase